MPRHTHLHRRKGSRSYYFRCKVPVDLLDHYRPKKEIIRSLGTSDRKEALARVKLETLKQDQEFDEVRRKRSQEPVTSISPTEIERLTALITHSVLSADEESRTEGLSQWDYERSAEWLESFHRDFRPALARGDISVVEDRVEDLLYLQGIELEKDSEDYRKLAYAFLKALVKAQEMRSLRHRGEVVDTPPPPPPAPSDQPVQADESSPPLSVAFAQYKDERRLPAKTVGEFWAQIRRFIELHGDLPITAITKAHVRAFKDAMFKLPARPGRGRQNLTVQELIAIAEADPTMPRLTPQTVNDKALGALRAVLGWAVDSGYLDNSPATGIKVTVNRNGEDTRLPFSIDDLNRIFRFPIFTEGERPRGGGGEAAKWLPILALFTGARLEELGQLFVEDVKQDGQVWFLDMTTAEKGKRFKRQSSKRKVPLHPELIRLGFMDYLKERQAAGDARLFPLLMAGQGERMTSGWSKWWGRYCRQHGMTDPRKVFHSFRHTVKDGLRDCGVPEAIADVLQGHAPSNVGGTYGAGYSLPVLAEELAKLSYRGFTAILHIA